MISTDRSPARRLARPLLVALALLLAPVARGQDKLTQAREHFDRGTAWFQQKQYDLALKELMEAYVLDPNPSLVYNIARVHEEKGDLDNALKFFKSFLTIAPRARNAPDVRRRIASLQAAIKRRPKMGALALTSDPPGATVRVDGTVVGQTPFGPSPFPTGKHRVEVALERFDTWRDDVLVLPANTAQLDVKLRDRPTSVLIATEPSGGQAIIFAPDPRPLGTCPCVAELSAGRYRLRIEHPGYQPKDIEFVKQPGETLRLNVPLVTTQVTGRLVVQTPVPGAEVRVDGTAVGRTPMPQGLDLRPGQVGLEIVAPGYRLWRGAARIEAGQVTTVQAMLDPMPITPPPVYVTDDTRVSTQATWGWVAFGVGMAAIAGGGTTLGLSLYDKHSFDNGTFFKVSDTAYCPGGAPGAPCLVRQDLTRAGAQALEDRSRVLMNTSIGLLASGGALLVTGIVLLATDDPGPDTRGTVAPVSVAPLPGGGMVSLDLTWP